MSSPLAATPLLITLIAAAAAAAAARDSLPRGASMAVEDYRTDVLRSPDGAFSCGFYSVSPTVFIFSIWFTRSAAKTVVWSANRARPVHSKGSVLALDAKRGRLVLTDFAGEAVWNSTGNGTSAASARLLGSGNLVIEDARGAVLWQSLASPTDTLLAGQPITGAAGLASADRLLAAGFYSFRFSDYALLSLTYDDHRVSSIYWPDPYFSYWQNGRKLYNFSRVGAMDARGHFLASDNATFEASDLGLGITRRLTLDTDGNLRLYSLQEATGAWSVSWMAFANPCIIHGVCGASAVCVYAPAPVCVCAPGHRQADPGDWSRGCKPMFNSSGGSSRRVKFVPLPHTDFWGYDLNSSEFLSLDACAQQCVGDPSCVVFQYKQGKGECFPKSLMFNGRTFPGLPGTVYIKIPEDVDVPEQSVHQWQASGLAIREVVVGCEAGGNAAAIALNVSNNSDASGGQGKSIWFYFYGLLSAFFVIEVFVVAFGCWLFSEKGVFRPSAISAARGDGYKLISSHFRAFSYAELERATENFKHEIGRGGSGIVYKGTLDDERVVAVKVLQDVSHSEEVFQAELGVIARIYHMNLVRMWGFCTEGTHRILASEYISNGSLAEALFASGANAGAPLPWHQRFKIALGVAKGLAYLHDECLEWIIHCDMKPENILLDEDMEPKITDFGLAKLLTRDGSGSDMSKIRGTRGYMAPEWLSSLPVTDKVDVYSFGVVMLELMKGARVSEWVIGGREGAEADLRSVVRMIRDKLERSEGDKWVMEAMDERLNGDFNRAQAMVLLQVAVSCLEEDRNKRPSMKSVVQILISAADEARALQYSRI